MPPKNRDLLAGYKAKELFGNMTVIDRRQMDLFDDLLLSMLEEKESAALDAVRALKSNQWLLSDIHQALAVGDIPKALKLIGMDKS